jgi:hypothetical protein
MILDAPESTPFCIVANGAEAEPSLLSDPVVETYTASATSAVIVFLVTET